MVTLPEYDKKYSLFGKGLIFLQETRPRKGLRPGFLTTFKGLTKGIRNLKPIKGLTKSDKKSNLSF